MFKNINTKHRFLINMIIAQIGFFSISISAIYSSSKIITILILNLSFALIILYTNYAAMKRVVGGIDRFKLYMDDIMNFVFMRTNNIKKASYMKNDEIGLILKELNTYVENFELLRKDDMKVLGEMVLSMDKISQGIYKCKINSQSDNFMIQALRTSANDMIDDTNKSMEELKNTLLLYSQDDFRKNININPDLTGEMLIVMESVNTLGKALNANAKENFTNGKILENDSSKMNESAKNVSLRANEQAASLEEVAAALEEITSITSNNTQNAIKMANLGDKVKSSVKKGQVLANQTTSSMDNINQEINAISEAIIVIDQIAFQTNILSLNAAVEAATAGEAGKGFAVVAQEVRNLASRSAQAAKEIKELVQSATIKANEGKTISDEMISGYIELNTNISETIILIDDVSTASKEQMSGIEQINDSVSKLDHVTQENASEANSLSLIAKQTLQLAKNLVEDAKNKKFCDIEG